MEGHRYESRTSPEQETEHTYDSIQRNSYIEVIANNDTYITPINQAPQKDLKNKLTAQIRNLKVVSIVLGLLSVVFLIALIVVASGDTNNTMNSQLSDTYEYAVMFAKNFFRANVELIIATESDAVDRYSVPPDSFKYSSVTTNIIRRFYTKDIITTRNKIENKGVIINARSDSLVIGFSTYDSSTRCCSSDGFNAIAAPNLGREYMVVTLSEAYTYMKYIGVVALHENTKISFRLNTTDSPYTTQYNITLNRKDTYQFTRINDLTGTIIKGDNSFAVFSGDECEIYQGGNCSHTVENIPKITDLGKQYIIPEFRNITTLFVKIVPTKSNTLISITSSNNASNYYTTSNYIQMNIDKGATTYISASSQILVSAYASFNNKYYFMTLIPPTCQYSNNFILVTPSLKRFYNFCSVIVESRYADGLILNKTPLKLSLIDERVSVLGNKSWRTITFLLPDGASTLRHPNINVKFAFIQYGHGSGYDTVYDNYAFPSQFNFNQSTSKCNI